MTRIAYDIAIKPASAKDGYRTRYATLGTAMADYEKACGDPNVQEVAIWSRRNHRLIRLLHKVQYMAKAGS